jgi:DNA-binding NarL/FixJ family response regulator
LTAATVLVVVEVEPDVRLLIRTALMVDARIHVDGEAASAREAIDLAQTMQPGLIILDHAIVGSMTGLEAAPHLKKAAPDSKILLFTAFNIEDEANAEPAVDEFLSKSRMRDLLPTVQRMLGLPSA